MTESWQQAQLAHRNSQASSIAAAALALVTRSGAPALTMAAIAKEAGVSRQTLYRYFGDVDAVLVAVAELVAAHEDAFDEFIAQEPDPRSQLDLLANAIIASHDQSEHGSAALAALLPPEGREILARHEAKAADRLADILRRGALDGSFRSDLDPDADAPLILGLLAAADRAKPDRALTLTHQLTQTEPRETNK